MSNFFPHFNWKYELVSIKSRLSQKILIFKDVFQNEDRYRISSIAYEQIIGKNVPSFRAKIVAWLKWFFSSCLLTILCFPLKKPICSLIKSTYYNETHYVCRMQVHSVLAFRRKCIYRDLYYCLCNLLGYLQSGVYNLSWPSSFATVVNCECFLT